MSSAGSCRGIGRTARQVDGDVDHELRLGIVPDYVDASRSALNSVIIKTKGGVELTELCEKRRALRDTKRVMKSNACVSQSILISFGKDIQPAFEALPVDTQNALYLQLMEKIAKEAQTDVSGLVAHRDETAPHAHGQLIGYNREGIPLTKVMNRQFRKDMQDWMVDIFAPKLPTLVRGVPKSVRLARGEGAATTIHKSVAELHGSLMPQIEAAKLELAKLRDEAEVIKARTDKLAAKENLTSTKEKTLAAYERRLAVREEAIVKIEIETARLSELAADSREQAILDGLAEGRARAVTEAEVARETANMLLTGSLPATAFTPQAAALRQAVIDIPKLRQAEDARMRVSPYAERETWAWSKAARDYVEQLSDGVWESARSEIQAAHEQGHAILDALPKSVPLLRRAQNLAKAIASYWSGICAAFTRMFDPLRTDKFVTLGVLEMVLPQPINEFGYLQPLMVEAEREVATINLSQKLQQQNDPQQH